MMWVIRAGKGSLYYKKYIEMSKVYLPWDGYDLDLSTIKDRADFRMIVEREKKTTNRTSISNWAGQLYTFLNEIQIGDYVLIPSKGSRTYALARIKSSYSFDQDDADNLFHSRDIEILEKNIPRSIFNQSIIYSLGAFRTIFRAKHEDEILSTINKWKEAAR